MRSRWLVLLAMLLLLLPVAVLGQGKGKAKGKAEAPGQETSEQAKAAQHGKFHWWHAKKKGKNKGKKAGQEQAVPGKKGSK